LSIVVLVKFSEYAEHAFIFQLDFQLFVQFVIEFFVEFVKQLPLGQQFVEQFAITRYSLSEQLFIVQQLVFQQYQFQQLRGQLPVRFQRLNIVPGVSPQRLTGWQSGPAVSRQRSLRLRWANRTAGQPDGWATE